MVKLDEMSLNCDECRQQFQNVEDFCNHRLRHFAKIVEPIQNKYLAQDLCSCPLCSKITTKCSIRKTKYFICDVNLNIFFQENPINYYKNNPHKNYRFICSFCNRSFARQFYLDRHIKSFHSSTLERYPCDICPKIFRSEQYLIHHRRIHNDEECLKCTYCDKRFVLDREVEAHISRIHQKSTKMLICGDCPKIFTSQDSLRLHKKIHTDECFICPQCQRKFARGSELKLHIKRVHNAKEKLYPCKQCPMVFTTRENQLAHRKLHTNNLRNFMCQKCPKMFKRAEHLKRHDERMHSCSERQRYPCEQCSKVFSRIETLRSHMNIHTDRCFICSYCNKKFSRRDEVNEHTERIHLKNDHQFQCDVCLKRFWNNVTLLRHKKIHTDLCYKCSLCDKKFLRQCDVDRHNKIHDKNSKKSFSCDICPKKFSNLQGVKSHKRIHTDSCFSCLLCDKKFLRQAHINKHVAAVHGIIVENRTEID